MKKNLTTYLYSTVGVAAMFFILIAVFVITSVFKQRLDLTADKVFTLAQGTKAILNKLDAPIQIRFYYSESLSSMPVFLKNHAKRIEDLLSEYQKYGKGNIEIKKFDPQPLSDAEDSANLDGVEGQMLQTGEKMYLGLAINCLDTKVAIGYLNPERERLLEYDITRAVSQVIRPEKPTIGVMSALQIFGEMNPMAMQMGRMSRSEPWVFISELKRDFNVKQVEMTVDRIDDDIKVLLVLYPRDITEKTEYALDQFVLRGGKMIAFLDPLSILDSRNQANNPMQRNMNSGASLDKLLKTWGIEFDKSKVVADMTFLTQINRQGRPERMPTVLSLTKESADTNDVATSQITSLLLPFAGSFSGTPAEGLKKTVLLKTSTDSQLVEKMMAEFSGEQVIKDFSPSGKEMALAVRLTGKFKTAFPEGKPKEKVEDKDKEKEKDSKSEKDEPALKESKTDGVVVLIGDADMLHDQFCGEVMNFLGQRIFQPRGDNLNLVQSLIEQMGGDSNLIAIRSRNSMTRPFSVVKKMEADAQARWQSKLKDLEKKLQDTQTKLNEMQSKKEGNQRVILSKEQMDAIAKFRQDQADINKELKVVQKNLRSDIDSLEVKLKWVNIAFMPFMVTLSGIALAIFKRKRTAAK
jgi:ABC-type uncharacterized transport system involved in gliding motility auxiliary subunit